MRKVGDRVQLARVGLLAPDIFGAITEVHEVPGHPHLAEYSVDWDDGEYADEIWGEDDFEPEV